MYLYHGMLLLCSRVNGVGVQQQQFKQFYDAPSASYISSAYSCNLMRADLIEYQVDRNRPAGARSSTLTGRTLM